MSQVSFDKYKTKGAYHWDWYNDPNYAWYKECVNRVVDFCKTTSVLDVGCGEGVIGELLFKRLDFDEDKLEYTGLEKEQSAIDLADPALDIRKTDIENDVVIYQPPGWDYLVCLNTIEHLTTPEPILNLLRQPDIITKGAIIITDQATGHKGRYHEHEYTLPELMKVFEEFKPAPFKIESTEHGKPITFIGVEIKK